MQQITNPATSRSEDGYSHPGLTIRVRRVNSRGQETASYPAVHIPAGELLTSSAWPLCRCGLCGGGGTVLDPASVRGAR